MLRLDAAFIFERSRSIERQLRARNLKLRQAAALQILTEEGDFVGEVGALVVVIIMPAEEVGERALP